jgi:hypothetical protein
MTIITYFIINRYPLSQFPVQESKGLSQKSTFFFWDSPKWEEMAGNGQKINALSQNRQEKRPKVGEEKGAVCF